MIYWILLPKAEEGIIELNQCQVNNSWLEATYYIYPWDALQKSSSKATQTDIPRWWLGGCTDKIVEMIVWIAKFLILISSPATESCLIDSIIPAEKVYCLGLFFSRLFSVLPNYFLDLFCQLWKKWSKWKKFSFMGFLLSCLACFSLLIASKKVRSEVENLLQKPRWYSRVHLMNHFLTLLFIYFLVD